MPFKDPQKAREYRLSDAVKKRSREGMQNKRKTSPEFVAKMKEWNRLYRKSGKEWAAIKANPKRYEKVKECVKRYYKKDEVKKRFNNETAIITDRYLLRHVAKKHNISRTVIKNFPDILNAEKELLKIKRTLYANKN